MFMKKLTEMDDKLKEMKTLCEKVVGWYTWQAENGVRMFRKDRRNTAKEFNKILKYFNEL